MRVDGSCFVSIEFARAIDVRPASQASLGGERSVVCPAAAGREGLPLAGKLGRVAAAFALGALAVTTPCLDYESSSLAVRVGTAHAFTEEQKLVAEAWRVVDQGFVDRTFNNQDWFKVRMKAVKKQYETREDAYQGIRNMLAKLDDQYTRFLSPIQYNSLTSSATGEVAGVGVELYPARVENRITIMSPVDGSPAERAGIKPKDVITEIDGEALDDLSPDEAAARIRGLPGSSVFLTIRSPAGQTERQVNLTRESLKLKTVRQELRGGDLGYVRIKQFNATTGKDVASALRSLSDNGATKFVLDLRDNPGGYFPAGVDVAELFLKEGSTVVSVVKNRGIPDEYLVPKDGLKTTEPLVVLVNKGTASASEILAGALKDNNRATLVGEKTFGKGVVQTLTELSDGSGVAVTIARYETPSHANINKIGIAPDLAVSCPSESDGSDCIPGGLL